MSKSNSRQRIRDLLSYTNRRKRDKPRSSFASSSHNTNDPSVAPQIGEVGSTSQSPASNFDAAPVQTQACETTEPDQNSHQEESREVSLEKPPPLTSAKSEVAEWSLWALAFDELRKANPELTKKFYFYLGVGSVDIEDGESVNLRIDRAAQKALEELRNVNSSKAKPNGKSATVRKCFERAVKVIIASKDFILSAVSVNPYAALAWTVVSLLLPPFLEPTQENEVAMKGLDIIAALMVVYRWQEKTYLQNDKAGSDFKMLAIKLYTRILDFEATLLVHVRRNPLERRSKNVFQAGIWSSYVESIQLHDANCRDVARAIDGFRAEEWRDEERRWQDKLLQQPREDEEKRHIRTLYSTYEASKNVNPERISGTCEWFLNHSSFLAWRESQSSSLLWLSADPGCGKSVLSKYLVDRRGEVLTVNIETPIVCYFFFKDGDIDRMIGAKALCALLHQLIMQRPHLYRYAKEDFENKNEKFLTDFDTLWNIFLKAAKDPSSCEIICVLDALDECQEHSRKALNAKLVEFYRFRDSNDSGKPILKFFVTSRPEFSIVRDFKEIPEVRLSGDEESEQISREIDLVIRHKVKELGKKMDLSKSDESNFQSNLAKIPHRTYLWLYLTFEDIQRKLDLSKNEIASITTNIPQNVDQAYKAILDKSLDKKRARKLLDIILAATRPLNLQEMNVAMDLNEDHKSYQDLDVWPSEKSKDRIKNICGLFVSVVDSKVYLIHQTAREYLVCKDNVDSSSITRAPSPADWKNSFYPPQSNLVMAEICIRYLQLRNFEGYDSTLGNQQFDTKVIDRYKKEYYFLSYAAGNWATHFSQAHSLPEAALIDTVAYRMYDTSSRAFRIWFSIYWKENYYGAQPSEITNILIGSYFGHVTVVRLLLERDDVQADSTDSDGRTPLSWAAEGGHEAVVRLLLERDDVQADSTDSDGRTPLSWAAEEGHKAIVWLLLERDDVQADSTDSDGRTPLWWAAQGGYEAVVRLLLERDDVQADSTDSDGRTPLSWAAQGGHEAVVRLLLERDDVQADSKDDYNSRTPLSRAAGRGHEAVARLLLGRDDVQADSKDGDGRTPLSWAAVRGHEAVVRLLLGRDDIQADSKDSHGRTPLLWAALGGHEAVVRLLLGRDDVQADSKDGDGRTPLLWAVLEGHKAVVRLLLERDDVQADSKDDHNGRTPLWSAVERGYEAVVRLLLRRDDIQADSKDGDGRTPLSLAAVEGHEAVVRLLLERDDVQADSKDRDGRTPLSWAAEAGHEAVVRLLDQRLHHTRQPHPPP